MSLENCPSSLLNFSDTELAGEETHSYRFEAFELNPSERQLLRNGEPIQLTPKAFEILTILVCNAGHLIKKEEIIETVWPDAFVEEANLTRLVHTLRKTLGENDDGAKFIETVAKQGYRFVGEVTKVGVLGDESADVWPDVVMPRNPALESSRRPITLMGLGGLIVIGMIAVLSLTWRGSGTDTTTPSIVVLPFRSIGSANGDEDLDLALTFELFDQLSQSKNLRIRSVNTTIQKYSDPAVDPAVVGREQKVDYVLISNYRAEGDRIKGRSELYRVATGSIEATFPFEATSSQIMGLAEGVAAALRPSLLARLNVEPVDNAQKRGAANDAAWSHFADGFRFINKRTKTDAEKAIVEFENAIRLDPNFAYGYIGLAQAHQTAVVNSADPALHCPQNLEAARKAVELAPSLGDAHTGYGAALSFCADDRITSEPYLRRGVELSPNSYYAHIYLGVFLAHRGGSPDESIQEVKKAIELNPDLVFLQRMLGRAYYFARRYDDAIPQFERAWELDPGEVEQALVISSAYELKRDLNRAFDWFLVAETNAGRGQDVETWKSLYISSGWNGVLRRRFERAVAAPQETTNDFFEVINTGMALGEIDKAAGYLERACSRPGRILNGLPVDPYLDALRADARWREIKSRCWKTGDPY